MNELVPFLRFFRISGISTKRKQKSTIAGWFGTTVLDPVRKKSSRATEVALEARRVLMGLTRFFLVAIILIDAFLSCFCPFWANISGNRKFFVINYPLTGGVTYLVKETE